MMPIGQVEAALSSFLGYPEPEVIAVKGDWGVSKTYIWQHFVARQKKVESYAGYSYASLFGISNLAELRRAVFTNQTSIGSPLRSADTFLRKGGAALARFTSPPGLRNTELLASVFEDKALRNIVICLDDLERKEISIAVLHFGVPHCEVMNNIGIGIRNSQPFRRGQPGELPIEGAFSSS
jgi:hypothetical protein